MDFRLIAAANESLQGLCEKGEFRQDLYYRLNFISLVIPPLRNRIDDIVPLANYFLEEICRENGGTISCPRTPTSSFWSTDGREMCGSSGIL
ncbi:MAG: sigma 54-interacting transcriptional regulator [Lachnospiraceae bacterium]|nr:sigma 54-interacting transcriptional regulator [Lachnospiraceae bacterium]